MSHYSRITSRYIREVICARVKAGLFTNYFQRKAMVMAMRTARAADEGQRYAISDMPRIFKYLKKNRDMEDLGYYWLERVVP